MLLTIVLSLAFSTPCQEDMACWNWRTMGNGTRGLVTLAGRHKVVDGHHFNELARVRRIDWARSAHLVGDD